MGFGDILGDTWDAVADTGETSLGVVMDLAKMSSEAATSRTFRDRRKAVGGFTSSFDRRRDDFLSEHKTLASLARGTMQTVAGGLYVLGLPYHAQVRSLSAAALYTGLPGSPTDENLPSFEQAWKASEKVSLGQAVMLNVDANNPKGINWKNAWKYGDKTKAQFDPEFGYTSGTFDALMIFTDPLIIAGKASKMIRLDRAKIKPEDIQGIRKAKGGVRVTDESIPATPPEVTPPNGFVQREPGIYYHGSNQRIEGLKDVDETDATTQLYGPGFYTTESQEIAGSYKTKGYDPETTSEVYREMLDEGLTRPQPPSGMDREAYRPPVAPWNDRPWYTPTNKEIQDHEKAVEKYDAEFQQRREALLSKYRDDDEAWMAEHQRRVESRAALHSVRWTGTNPPKMIDLDRPADDLFWETLAQNTPPDALPDNVETDASEWMTKAAYNLDKQGITRPTQSETVINDGPDFPKKFMEARQKFQDDLDDYKRKVQEEAQRIADEHNAKIGRVITPDRLRESLGLDPSAPARTVYRTWGDLFEYDDVQYAEGILQGVRHQFQEMGYDGFTHRGGHIIGDGYNHQVSIWFDTSQLELSSQVKGAFVAAPARAAEARRRIDVLPADPSGLSRRQRRVVSEHEGILDATEGREAIENYTLFARKGVNNAAALASVLSMAKNDREMRSLILRHSMGDEQATELLSAQRQDIIDQINRMNQDLDDQIFPEFGTADHGGLFDVDYWDNPEAREQLLRQRDDSEQVLDAFNRTLGDQEKMLASAMNRTIPTQDEVGLRFSVQAHLKAKKRDLQWMKGQSAYYIQPGVGGIVTRVARSPHNLRPSGYVDFHDADQAVREVDALTKRVPGLLPEQRADMLNRFINAPDDNARRMVLEGIERDVWAQLGRHFGYDTDDVQELAMRFFNERQQAVLKAKQGGGNIYGFTGKDVAEKRPLAEAQLDNGAYTLPIDMIKRVLRRNAGRYRALKNVSGQAFSITDQMLDVVNDLWRFEALFRGGYPIRNAADAQLRMLAYLGAHETWMVQRENARQAVRNDLNQTRRYMGRDAVDEPLGVGPRQRGGYTLADAFGMSPDEARLYMDHISSAESTASMFNARYLEILNELRGTGRWVSKRGDEPGWEDDFLRVINQQLRGSAIAQRLLRGDEPEQVVAWLKSGEGRALRRRMVYGSDSAEALVLRNMENLNHVLPREYWRTAHDRPLLPSDVAEIWGDNLASRPIINAEQIAHSLGVSKASELVDKVTRAYFNKIARLTDDQMGRHPLFVSLYRGRQIELMKRIDPKLRGDLDLATQRVIEEQARVWAKREMKSVLFDVAQKSDLAHFVRFIMPFYAAWQDAFTKYGRLMVRDPSRLAYLQHAWTAPNDASFLEVTDSDGNPVSAEDAKLSDDEGVVIPFSWAKKMGLNWSPKISKASFNIALQGDPVWLPGWGPMGTAPINQFIRKTDNTTLASAAESLGILPFGVQDYGKYGHKAFFAGALRQQALPEGRRQRMLASVMQDMYFEAAKAGKPEPKWKDIRKRYQELLDIRTFTSALSPVSIQYQSPYQFYIDQSHAYDERVGKPGGFKDFAEADKAFLRDFGEDYYIFRMSMSKTNVGIRPSKRADKEALRLRDLIEANPRYASLFIGPSNTGEYDRNVYSLQSGRTIGGTTDKWRDTYSNPKEAIRLNRVEHGWIEYQRMSARINAQMEARGLTSLNQSAANDLRMLKHEWLETVAGPGGPDWGSAWYADYQQFGSSSITDFLGAATTAVGDDRINKRSDIQALGVYLAARNQVRSLLQQRYANGGSASLTSDSNSDVAQVWGELMTGLRQSNVYFEDYWSRYLERDDLTKVVR